MSKRLSAEFRRWSRWYPSEWRADSAAAMLGVYLDAADAEERDRLTSAEKLGLVAGGISARADKLVPGTVRDLTASIALGLLGMFGLVTGVVFEWAPWSNPARLATVDGYLAGLGASQHSHFGPFLSPYVAVAALAVLAWALGYLGPAWLYRSTLAALAVAGMMCAAAAHFGWGNYMFLRAEPALFATAFALIALAGARPRRLALTEHSVIWLAIFFVGTSITLSWKPLELFHRGGVLPSSAFFSVVVESAMAFLGCFAALLAALVLAIARRRVAAAAIVIVSVPWVLVQLVSGYDSAAVSEGAYLGVQAVLLLGYLAAAVVAMFSKRAAEIAAAHRRGGPAV